MTFLKSGSNPVSDNDTSMLVGTTKKPYILQKKKDLKRSLKYKYTKKLSYDYTIIIYYICLKVKYTGALADLIVSTSLLHINVKKYNTEL